MKFKIMISISMVVMLLTCVGVTHAAKAPARQLQRIETKPVMQPATRVPATQLPHISGGLIKSQAGITDDPGYAEFQKMRAEDSDLDGVPNDLDQCQNTPFRLAKVIPCEGQPNTCPELIRDGMSSDVTVQGVRLRMLFYMPPPVPLPADAPINDPDYYDSVVFRAPDGAQTPYEPPEIIWGSEGRLSIKPKTFKMVGATNQVMRWLSASNNGSLLLINDIVAVPGAWFQDMWTGSRRIVYYGIAPHIRSQAVRNGIQPGCTIPYNWFYPPPPAIVQ